MRNLSFKKSTFRAIVIALGALAAGTGCKVQKPGTPVPPPATITSFTASATEVAAGTQITLSWDTENVTSIELREANSEALPVPADTVDGTFQPVIDAPALFVLVARGPGGSDARALSVRVAGGSVSEVSFKAIPPEINGGDETTLVWAAPGASAVALTANGQAVDLMGLRSSGAITVSPANDTSYVLTADSITRTVMVSVSPAIVEAAVNPPAAEVGQMVTVSWSAPGADRLVLSSPGRGQLFETTTAAQVLSGSFTEQVPPAADDSVLFYELTAFKGSAQVSRRVELNVGTGLSITRFVAPPVAAAGATYSVRWETLGADQVDILVDGVTVFVTPSATAAANGSFSFTSPTADFAVEALATNRRGARDSQRFQVDAVGVPALVTLSAMPTSVTVGQPVTLTWAAQEARRVRITDTSGAVVFSTTGQPAEGGTAMVYPTANTTYTISADNQLGNPAVTATAAVTVTGAGPTLGQFPPYAIDGQNVDLTTSEPGAVLYGLPHNRVLESTVADFIDISATGTRVIEGTNDLQRVDLSFSTVLWGARTTSSLTISRAGWMAWGAPLTVLSSNSTSFPSSTGPGGMIAPFWDDLQLIDGTSGVYVQVLGNAPEELLVVQWDKLRVGTNSSTEVTFQVQVHQRGMVSFQYKTMDLPSSPSYLVGLQNPSKQVVFNLTQSPPAANSARYFFSPLAPPIEARAFSGLSVAGTVKTGSAYLPVARTFTTVQLPRDLVATEVMFRPSSGVVAGQYLEVLNRSTQPVDLLGWQVSSPGVPTFRVTESLVALPNVPLVIGASTNAAENDDAGVSYAWGASGFRLPEDGGTLTLGTADAGVNLTFAGPSDGGRGASTEYDLGLIGPTSATPSCESTRLFGEQSPQQRGTPGSQGFCFPYRLETIPSRFVDVSDGGTPLLNSPTSTVDGRTVPITLAATAGDPAPFAFGVRRPEVSMSTDGWMVWGSSTSTNFSNTTLLTGTPLGKLAIFWDDMQTTLNLTPRSEMFWKRFAANEDPQTPAQHWVFQWSRMRHYNTSPADDLNYEVKLFEDGTIEYHYGTMFSGTSSNYGDGNSATIWLENPQGTAALPISVEVAAPRANTAYRFVPR